MNTILTILRKIRLWMTLCTRYEPSKIASDWIQPPPELARRLTFCRALAM
jgi:hypothetical protein